MANTTLPDSDHNVVQDDYERKFQEGNFEERLKNTPSQDEVEDGLRKLEERGNSNNDKVNDSLTAKESSGDKQASYIDNVTPSGGTKEKGKTFDKAKFWKRTGIIGGGGGIVGIALFFISGFLPLGGILLNLGEVATANRDTQNNILTKRLYKVIDSKIGGDMTKGSCQVVKIACRFSRPSNMLLSRLADQGIEALDKSGNPIKKSGVFGDKPEKYRFKGQEIDARSFTKTLGTNTEFRKAFTSAFNMRYWGYADSFIKKLFYKKADIDRSGKSISDIDSKDPGKTVKTLTDGAEKDNKIKVASGEDAKKSALTTAIADDVSKQVENVSKKAVKTKADPIIMAGTAVCIGINVPGMFAKVAWLYQKRQEILLASTFVLTASSMLKSGDMKPEQMATIGTLLTATSVVAGKKTKSAMDSAGIRNILFNDSVSGKSDSSLARFIPGKSARDATAGITAIAQSEGVRQTCEAIQSPAAQLTATAVEATIGAATAGVGAAVIATVKALGTTFAAIVASETMLELLKPAIQDGVKLLVSSISADTLDQLIGNPAIATAKEEDFGNALGGGLNYFFTDAALSTGSKPLTKSQLASYQKESQDTMLAYAEQDRFGRSPFDISSPYTFLGSIFANYYQNAYVAGNVSNTILSSIGYTLSQPFRMFSTNSYAATNNLTDQYNHAADFGANQDIAVGVYGNVAAGIPTQYSDISSTDLLRSVSDQVSDTSGQPNDDSNIQTSLNDCSDGDVYSAGRCAITNQQAANESLYMYDLRINDMLDGTNTDKDETSSSTSSVAGATVDEANLFNDSTSVACAPGTDDAGLNTGYNQGNPIPIRLCSIPGTVDTGHPGYVNSRASGAALAMFNQMKSDLGLTTITLNDSFRTYEQQVEAKATYGAQAASPGYSRHQMGYAFDISMGVENGGQKGMSYSMDVNTSYPGNKVWEWLKANAGNYHFMQFSREGWHWSINGE